MDELLYCCQNLVVVSGLSLVLVHELELLGSTLSKIRRQYNLKHFFQKFISQPNIVLKQFFVTLDLCPFVKMLVQFLLERQFFKLVLLIGDLYFIINQELFEGKSAWFWSQFLGNNGRNFAQINFISKCNTLLLGLKTLINGLVNELIFSNCLFT